MYSIRKKNSRENEVGNLEDEVEKYVNFVIKRLNPKAIILYGSRAKGTHKPWSDYDILIIVENLPPPKDRWNLLTDIEIKAPIEPKAFTPKEFLKLLDECNITALDAIYEGKALYDQGFIKIAKKKFKEVKEKYQLKKIPRGWNAQKLNVK